MFGDGVQYVKHYRPEVGEFAPRTAKRIGSAAFDGPAPQGDPYLRLYDSRAPVGEWARPVLEKTPYADALHYRGNIFRGWRWEFLMSMQSTVLTRAALERVGTFGDKIPFSERSQPAARKQEPRCFVNFMRPTKKTEPVGAHIRPEPRQRIRHDRLRERAIGS